MVSSFAGLKIAVLGGDSREIYLTKYLAGLGYYVYVYGLPVPGEEKVYVFPNLARALEQAKAAVLPLPGVNEQGELYCAFLEKPPVIKESDLGCLPPGAPIFVGLARPYLRKIAHQHGYKLIELLALDEVAILNSIPSAEGAIQLAMEKLPITIHHSESFVLGFGRTGATIAQLLVALGARTVVVARSPAQRARAFQMNCRVYDFSALPSIIGRAEIIFNTVPALVIDEALLRKISPQALIIDLASSPGGVDFQAAARLGVHAFLAPGLPGKVAPKTAGQILSRVIHEFLMKLFPGSS